jgi:hypothetical protein
MLTNSTRIIGSFWFKQGGGTWSPATGSSIPPSL